MAIVKAKGQRAPTLNPNPDAQRTIDRHKLRPLYDLSVEVLMDDLKSGSELIRNTTAKYVIDQIVGKGVQQIKNEHTSSETALVLAEAMKQIIQHLPSPESISGLSPHELLIEDEDGVFRVPSRDT